MRIGGVDPHALVREAVLFGARHREGWGAGLTVLTALGNLLRFLPEDKLCLALFQGIRRVADDCDGAVPPRPRHALAGQGHILSTVERWLCEWVLARHRDGAERTLLTAIAAGESPAQIAKLMLIASTERFYADGGHVLDFVNKALDAYAAAKNAYRPRRRDTALYRRCRFGRFPHFREGRPEPSITVMGAAVNRAARLQGLTRGLARPVLTSADFAACIEEPVESLGRHTMKDLQEPQQIFAIEGL